MDSEATEPRRRPCARRPIATTGQGSFVPLRHPADCELRLPLGAVACDRHEGRVVLRQSLFPTKPPLQPRLQHTLLGSMPRHPACR